MSAASKKVYIVVVDLVVVINNLIIIMFHYKLITLIIVALILGLVISLSPFLFKSKFFKFQERPITTTTSPTLSTTTTTIPKISSPIGLKGTVKVENNITIQYEILREGIISDPKGMRKIYDVELKATNYKTFTKDNINLVSKEIINQIIEEEKDIKEIDMAFFSDRGLITNKQFDIAYSTWQANTNEIIIILRKDLKIEF